MPDARGRGQVRVLPHQGELTLEIYDVMAKAIATGTAYQTILNPPAGEGPRHPARPESA